MKPQRILLIGIPPYQAKLITEGINGPFEWLFFEDIPERRMHVDVILLNHDLPIFNGLEKLPYLSHRFGDIPVVMTGPSPAQHDLVEAFRLGARDFLFLPIQSETLLNCLYRFQTSRHNRARWWEKILPVSVARLFTPSYPARATGLIPSTLGTSQSAKHTLLRPPDVQVKLLGPLSIIVKGQEVDKLPGKKARELLAFILHRYPKPVHRDILIDTFWGDSLPDSARNCLNVTIHAIRKSFSEAIPQEEIIVFQDECYGLNPSLEVERDTDLFESYWKKGRRIETELGMEAAIDTYHQAFAFYRGDFLEDFPYQEWTERQRDKLRETWLVILDRLSAHFCEKGRFQISMNLCKRILEKDDCLEEVHRRLMECYVQLGMREMAIRQYKKCELSLHEELNVHPARSTTELYHKIREDCLSV